MKTPRCTVPGTQQETIEEKEGELRNRSIEDDE